MMSSVLECHLTREDCLEDDFERVCDEMRRWTVDELQGVAGEDTDALVAILDRIAWRAVDPSLKGVL